jgi:hypothetical protein
MIMSPTYRNRSVVRVPEIDSLEVEARRPCEAKEGHRGEGNPGTARGSGRCPQTGGRGWPQTDETAVDKWRLNAQYAAMAHTTNRLAP